jgi:hypothetical protein
MKETPKPRVEGFVCMFCDHVGHLDEFYFRCKRIEKRCYDYVRNSYRDEFIDFLPLSYSRVLPRTYSRALPQFSHGSNHHSYGFDSQENHIVPRHFGYGPHPHHGDRTSRRPDFPVEGSHTYFELRHLDGPRLLHHGSRPTRLNGDVQKIMKTSSGRMVKC